jgi:hypothetical protein
MIPRTKSLNRMTAIAAVIVCWSSVATAQTPTPRGAPTRGAARHIWYVSAAGLPNGDGSEAAPLNSLGQVQDLSVEGDTIIVVPSPSNVAPLDGGIVLKPNQHLIGGGPPVLAPAAALIDGGPTTLQSAGLAAVPVITNSTGGSNNGDAVRLANGAEVANLVIKGAFRGGIYGLDALDVNVHDNDISGADASGVPGFIVQEFYLEQYAPGVASHTSIPAGWGAILIDGSIAHGDVQINGNYVHDGACSDGIDIRAANTSVLTATFDSNFVTRLHQCSTIHTLEGIATQATGNGKLTVTMDQNTEANNGNSGANSDSLFTNIGGSGQLTQTIDHNAYFNGIGGASTNGFEFIIGDGVNAVGNVKISNSTFLTNPGDMLEEFNRGITSSANLVLDNVKVFNTTVSGGLPTYGMPAGTAATPDNTGECLGIASVGANDLTVLKMTNSQFSGCGNNGIEVTNNHTTADGDGFPHTISLDIENSKISGSKYYNLWMNNVTPLTQLRVKVQDTDLSGSTSGVAVGFDQQPTAATLDFVVDLGGGSLGSIGENCFGGGSIYDFETTGYTVSAMNDWWGQASGPAAGKLLALPANTSSINYLPVLASAPAACAAH